MSTGQTEQLMEEVKKLSQPELRDFIAQVLALNAQHNGHSLPQNEVELIARINETLPTKNRNRLQSLVAKSKKDELTQDEQDELSKIIDEVENFDARRVQALGELAMIRRVTLPEIMTQLGIKPPPSPMKRVTNTQRQAIFASAGGCCEYCMSQASFATESFSIEHIYPTALGGESVSNNLALSCMGCNGHKAKKIEWADPLDDKIVPLYNPRTMRWNEHFTWERNFTTMLGLTPIGRATIELLQMNRASVKNLRLVLYLLGLHPPIFLEKETDEP